MATVKQAPAKRRTRTAVEFDTPPRVAGLVDRAHRKREKAEVLKTEAFDLLQEAVNICRDHGLPWREAGAKIGTSGARAEQISRGVR